MMRALAAVMATSVTAHAELPSPLFCETLLMCAEADLCVAPDQGGQFVVRQTGGEWVTQNSPGDSDAWIIVAETAEAVVANAPEGARIAMIEAGLAEDGAILLHQHMLEPDGLSPHFMRHACRPGAESTS